MAITSLLVGPKDAASGDGQVIREPEYWGFGRAGQPSVFGGNWLIRALFVGLPSGHRRQVGRERTGGGSRRERGRDATHLAARAAAWVPGDALIEFVGRFRLGLCVVFDLMVSHPAIECTDTASSPSAQSHDLAPESATDTIFRQVSKTASGRVSQCGSTWACSAQVMLVPHRLYRCYARWHSHLRFQPPQIPGDGVRGPGQSEAYLEARRREGQAYEEARGSGLYFLVASLPVQMRQVLGALTINWRTCEPQSVAVGDCFTFRISTLKCGRSADTESPPPRDWRARAAPLPNPRSSVRP
jgi:hypothetical protein